MKSSWRMRKRAQGVIVQGHPLLQGRGRRTGSAGPAPWPFSACRARNLLKIVDALLRVLLGGFTASILKYGPRLIIAPRLAFEMRGSGAGRKVPMAVSGAQGAVITN
jgi:hypothetical protein